MPLRAAVLVLFTVSLATPDVHANRKALEKMAQGAVQRARRGFAIGPTLGVAAAYAAEPGEVDWPISFGVRLHRFDIPVLDAARLRARIQERAGAKMAERLKELVAQGKPMPGNTEMGAMGRQIVEEAAAEVFRELDTKPRVLEKPSFTLGLEGAYLVRSEAWQIRAGGGVGLRWVTLGPTVALHLDDDTGVFVGGELGLHLLPGRGARSPVIDLFLRADVPVVARDAYGTLFFAGARVLLDLI